MLTLQEIISTVEGLSLDKRLGMNNLYEECYILRFSCVCTYVNSYVCVVQKYAQEKGVQVYVLIHLL